MIQQLARHANEQRSDAEESGDPPERCAQLTDLPHVRPPLGSVRNLGLAILLEQIADDAFLPFDRKQNLKERFGPARWSGCRHERSPVDQRALDPLSGHSRPRHNLSIIVRALFNARTPSAETE